MPGSSAISMDAKTAEYVGEHPECTPSLTPEDLKKIQAFADKILGQEKQKKLKIKTR